MIIEPKLIDRNRDEVSINKDNFVLNGRGMFLHYRRNAEGNFDIVYTKNNKNSNEYDTVANYIMLITDGHERNIEVKYAKDQDPIRDYYFREENSRITTINGINLKIYKYGNSFYTIFSYNGYNFDIETSNITEQEFSNYIVSILK